MDYPVKAQNIEQARTDVLEAVKANHKTRYMVALYALADLAEGEERALANKAIEERGMRSSARKTVKTLTTRMVGGIALQEHLKAVA